MPSHSRNIPASPRRREPRLGLLALACFGALSCGDGGTSPTPPSPTPGAVAISTATSGLDPSPYYYWVEVEGEGYVYVLRPETSDTVRGLSAGEHAVRLFGLPHHCRAPANPSITHVAAGQITPVAFQISCDRPDPDRIRAAFSSILVSGQEAEIYTMDLDGLGVVDVTNDAGSDVQPRWSPDGSRLAFLSDRGSPGVTNLYVMNFDGTGLRRLTDQGAETHAWSRDGTRLGFVASTKVYLVGADGQGTMELPGLGDTLYAQSTLDWSPDGAEVAVSLGPRGPLSSVQGMAVVSVADGVVRFLDGASTGGDASPRWSPDGSRLLFTRQFLISGCDIVCAVDRVMVAPLDGTPPAALDLLLGSYLAWTSDGSRVFSGRTLLSPDGSSRLDLERALLGEPISSPDGTRMQFPCDPVYGGGAALGICEMALDGSDLRQVADWGPGPTFDAVALRPWSSK